MEYSEDIFNEEVCSKTVSMFYQWNDEFRLQDLIRKHCTCFCSRVNVVESSPWNHALGCGYRIFAEKCSDLFQQSTIRTRFRVNEKDTNGMKMP